MLFLSIRNILPDTIYDRGWILVTIIIIFSAFFNSIGLSRLHSSIGEFDNFLAFFGGDVSGGIIFLLLAMYIWRILKNSNFE